MKRNKSLTALGGALALSAFAFFATAHTATAQSVTTFKKGSIQATQQLSASAAGSATVNNPAQEKAHRGEGHLMRLKQRLNLTDEQTTKIKTILQSSREQMKTSREQAGSDKDAFKKSMQEQFKNTDAQIQEVLTAEQRTQYAEVKAEMKEKRGRGDHRRHDKEND